MSNPEYVHNPLAGIVKRLNRKKIFDTYKPKGFHTVTTYLFVENPQELIDLFAGTSFNRRTLLVIL